MKEGDILIGVVIKVYPSFAILLFPNGETGLLHVSELSKGYVRNFTGYVKVGNIYRVKVIEVDEAKGFMRLSVKALGPSERRLGYNKAAIRENSDFAALRNHLSKWMGGNA